MAIMFHNNRQYPKYATAVITAAQGEGTKILLPPGAIMLRGVGGLVVTDAFAGSSPTISVTDNSQTPVGYIEAEALGALAYHPLETDIPVYYPAGAELTISFGGTVTAGSGEAIFFVGYLLKTAENELYGRSA